VTHGVKIDFAKKMAPLNLAPRLIPDTTQGRAEGVRAWLDVDAGGPEGQRGGLEPRWNEPL
jgi:hypothetical protein